MELISSLSLPELMALQWANNITRYLLIAGLTYMVFWKWCFKKLQHMYLYSKMPKSKDLRREFFLSLMTTMIFILPTFIIVSSKNICWSQLYLKIDDKGMLWYGLSFVVVFIMHDTYFYWTHRLMHHRRFYKYFHKTHHLSVDPSPLAAFAFHPLESMVEAGIFLLIPAIVPIHWSVLVLFTLFSLFMNVYGHLGFDLLGSKRIHKLPWKLFNHSTHHSWHHRFQRGNYGFYLQFWDRIMGTWKGELPVPDVKDVKNAQDLIVS